MSLGNQIIYKQLFQQHQRIRVPMIQRDYAQGRPMETAVREEFLNALKEALRKPADDPSLPLNLDFVYGSVEGTDETRFLPLDGQQRLTTLFLLHWYLAWRDEEWDAFTQIFQTGQHSRFSYSVRQSSTEFFDALVHYRPDVVPEDVMLIVPLISDQPWYFRSWRLDPTIQSVLNMLEAIHKHFASSTGFFCRLMNETQPAITFQLLNLENFGLSDDLYIKMNARGKPLTPFETFKARYEQELKNQFPDKLFYIGEQGFPVAEYVALRLDTTWADLFWKLRSKSSNLFDSALMNVFRAIALVTLDPDSAEYSNDVVALRSSQPAYTRFLERGWLSERFTLAIIHLLNAWTGTSGGLVTLLPNSQYFSEETFFTQIVASGASISYAELVQFAAYVFFIVDHDQDVSSDAFQEWMRIIRNLSLNTEYNRPDDFRRSIAGLQLMIEHSDDILRYFQDSTRPTNGFNEQQIAEEKVKANFILAHSPWRTLMDRAERHGYFQGQIEFLLDFSGILEAANSVDDAIIDDEVHLKLQGQFHDLLQKAEAMFNDSGLSPFDDYQWERSLLCVGDYQLSNGRNWSFLVNSSTEPASWKRFLKGTGLGNPGKRGILGDLWKRLDGVQDLSKQLDEIIAKATNLKPWMEAFVRTPTAIEYCRRRLIRWVNDHEIYLLQTTQMNGAHAELFTFCFYENFLSEFNRQGGMKSLNLLKYQSIIGTDTEPGISLLFPYDNSNIRIEIEFRKGEFMTYISREQVDSHPLIQTALLQNLGFLANGTNYISMTPPALMERFVSGLADKLSVIPSSEQ